MYGLTPEQEQIVNLARDYARGEILPGAAARDREHAYPADIIAALGDMGFMGILVPESWGGAGLDNVSYVMSLAEVAYADASVAVIMSVQNSLACHPILVHGTEAQKQRYLPDLAGGKKIGCYALTEPQCGSDAAALRTRAVKQPDGSWVLNGTKMWITNGPQAEVAVAYASTDPSQRHRTIQAFILERDWPGYRVGKVEEKLGICASGTSELVFEDLHVPAENMLGEENKGFHIAMATLDGGRIGIASQGLGIAMRALDVAVAYAKERTAFGKPIGAQQAIQWMIADMGTRIDAARLLILRAATLRDQGKKCGRECAMAKVFATETASFCADRALQIHGGYGYSKEYEAERLFRDARITTIYEGTSEIQRLVIARSLLE
ncbi:MAG: acyl-CoA dehydrogenase family protein [Deltaproteobacteria bacterium]|nr:acyl-CoA dehydrogenase family protein [Deltaproteobacteria bacterium]